MFHFAHISLLDATYAAGGALALGLAFYELYVELVAPLDRIGDP